VLKGRADPFGRSRLQLARPSCCRPRRSGRARWSQGRGWGRGAQPSPPPPPAGARDREETPHKVHRARGGRERAPAQLVGGDGSVPEVAHDGLHREVEGVEGVMGHRRARPVEPRPLVAPAQGAISGHRSPRAALDWILSPVAGPKGGDGGLREKGEGRMGAGGDGQRMALSRVERQSPVAERRRGHGQWEKGGKGQRGAVRKGSEMGSLG